MKANKILVLEPVAEAGIRLMRDAGLDVVDVSKATDDERQSQLADATAVIIRSGSQVDEEFMAKAPHLEAVARAGVGLDNIDLVAATRRGVAVMNTPGGNATAAAEHTMALMLSVARHVAPAHGSLAEGKWDRHRFLGVELAGRRLGLIGVGRVGSLVASRAQAFGMEVWVTDPFLSDDKAASMGVTRVELDRLVAECDVLSLHLPLTEETKQLINAESIARMKPGTILVNCARGGLIDEDAVAAALESGQLGGVAVDVFPQEPPKSSPLLGHPRVSHTPHLGASTQEAKENVSLTLARALVALFRDGDFSSVVNLPFGGADLRKMAPLLDLAQRLGRFQGGLLLGAPQRVELELATDDSEDPAPLASAFLTGLLEVVCGPEVNAVNAQLKAEEMGITLSHGRRPGEPDFPRLLSTRVSDGTHMHGVDGGLLAPHTPRIVRVDGQWMDVEPVGDLMVLWNQDRPGVLGKVATLLGSRNINVGELRMGRDPQASQAISVWQVDQPIELEVKLALKEIAEVEDVRQVRLGAKRSRRV